jgi:hypothetical protein
VTGGRKRGAVRHKGWLQRNRRHSPQPPVAPPEAEATEEGGSEPDAPASLDQVLRRAAEARKPEPDDS